MLRSFSSSASASERAASTALYGRIDSAASSTLRDRAHNASARLLHFTQQVHNGAKLRAPPDARCAHVPRALLVQQVSSREEEFTVATTPACAPDWLPVLNTSASLTRMSPNMRLQLLCEHCLRSNVLLCEQRRGAIAETGEQRHSIYFNLFKIEHSTANVWLPRYSNTWCRMIRTLTKSPHQKHCKLIIIEFHPHRTLNAAGRPAPAGHHLDIGRAQVLVVALGQVEQLVPCIPAHQRSC